MRFCLIILSICAFAFNLNAAESNLAEISENFNEYKDKEITISLRLKHKDEVFENIIFYDSKNVDISFDYSKNKPIKRMMKKNPMLHRGLMYKVKMIPREVDEQLNIKADLLNYEPAFLDKLPYGKAE